MIAPMMAEEGVAVACGEMAPQTSGFMTITVSIYIAPRLNFGPSCRAMACPSGRFLHRPRDMKFNTTEDGWTTAPSLSVERILRTPIRTLWRGEAEAPAGAVLQPFMDLGRRAGGDDIEDDARVGAGLDPAARMTEEGEERLGAVPPAQDRRFRFPGSRHRLR